MATRTAVTLVVLLALLNPIQAQPPEAAPPGLGRPTALPEPAPAAPTPVAAVEPVQAPEPVPAPTSGGANLPAPFPPITLVKDAGPFPCEAAPSHGPGERCWLTADYLLAWVRGSRLPPLVTTSPAGTPQASAGVLGAAGTSILFGNSTVNGDARSGIRLGAGGWFDSDHYLGLDVGFFMLESKNALFSLGSGGDPILARPFTDVTTSTPTAQLIAFPGVASGTVTASDGSNNFYSFHADFMQELSCDPHFHFDALLGYRFLRYTDRLAVDTTSVSAGAAGVVAGTQTVVSDRFTTQNVFHGADFGLRAEYLLDRLSLEAVGKLAVGNVHRSVGIAGTTTVTVPGAAPVVNNGGFLALSSNSGVFNSNDWIVIPELEANLKWRITDNLNVRLGYSVLAWTRVARAADQVDLNINPNLFPTAQSTTTTPRSPAFPLNKSELWVQGVNLGLEFRF